MNRSGQKVYTYPRRKITGVWLSLDQSRCSMWKEKFFAIMASRLTQYVMSNRYLDTTIQKGGVAGVPGCIEHTTMIWESIQQARRNRLSLYVVWLNLANAYGSVPHQLLWKTLENHAPIPVINILQEYFRGFEMRFSTMAYTTKWIPLQVGIAMGCAISPCLFVLAMQVLLNESGSHNDRVHIGRKFHTSSIKAFKDDTTLVINRKQAVQRSLDNRTICSNGLECLSSLPSPDA